MAKVTIAFAVLLIALGLVGYFGTPANPSVDAEQSAATSPDEVKPKSRSVTALIPSFVGIAILICGVAALREPFRKHAMHIAATIGLLGFLAGSFQASKSLGKVFSGDPTLNWRSFTFVALMAAICAAYVATCFNSFMQARKTRLEEEAMSKRSTE